MSGPSCARCARLSEGRDRAILEARELRDQLDALRGAAEVLARSASCNCTTGYRCARCTVLDGGGE